MQYIKTKYLGPTNHRGSRVKAVTSYGETSVTMSWDHALDSFENHKAAALALISKLNWGGERYYAGGSNTGYVFVAGHEFTSFVNPNAVENEFVR